MDFRRGSFGFERAWLLLPGALVACASPATAPSAQARGGPAGGAGSAGEVSAVGGSVGAAGSTSGGSAGVSGSAGGAGTFGGDAGGTSMLEAGAPGIAGTAGAAGTAGTASCAGMLCEDFEQGSLDETKWTLLTGNGGTALVQQDLAAHGKHALKVHGLASAKDDYALIVTKQAPAQLKGAHFGRANFYITPKPLTSGHTQMLLAGINGTGPANGPGPLNKLRYLEIANINAGWQFGFDLLDVSPLVEEVFYPTGSPQVPTMKWSCLEWQFTDQPDTASVWVDGQSLGTFDDAHVSYPAGHTPGAPLYNGTSSGLIGSFNLFGFGFHDWHPHAAFDLYYDDIVLDTARIGCMP